MSELVGVKTYGESNTKNYLKCMTNKHCVFIPTSEYTEQCRSQLNRSRLVLIIGNLLCHPM
ncbi:hypothetical protein FVG97_00580 [Salmonella enterica]|nr:hypothetical protein [Salmonella enterica]EBN9758039.1 hypothetical protein [Salmonella enterica]ECS6291781.1 hypothetical protein [Salmonella enterica subsp. enterica serovar Birkenhead]ECV3125725.1 hypothetical protein [Salmonella enterica]EEA7511115.1 hypothetical protein [Salmonella enterica]